MAKNTSVIGIYTDRTTVSDAIDVLHKEGYRAADISVLSSDNQGSKDFGHEKHTKAAEGAAAGAAIGAVIGAALAWLVSIQTVAIPVLAPLAAATWTGAGCFGWRGRRRSAGMDRGIAGGLASVGIRRQAVRGPDQAWRYSPVRSLRRPGVA